MIDKWKVETMQIIKNLIEIKKAIIIAADNPIKNVTLLLLLTNVAYLREIGGMNPNLLYETFATNRFDR